MSLHSCSAHVRSVQSRFLGVLAVCLTFLAMGSGGRAPAGSVATATTLRAAAAQHHLLMGTAADSDLLSEPQYASILHSEYSVLEPESEMKFDEVHPSPDQYAFSGPDALVSFAERNSMKVRGHNLLWHEALPDWLLKPAQPWTPSALNKILSDHIATVAGHYRGKVFAWDAVNEPFNEDGSMRDSIWYNKPGIGYAGKGTKMVEKVLRWAHTADPNAKLFVNEFGAEVMNKKSDAVYRMAKDFVQRGVPLSGIGLQLHVDSGFSGQRKLTSLARNIQRLTQLGLEVQFTEVDVRLPNSNSANLGAQAKTYVGLLNVCLENPKCTLFQTWGFTDRHSWVPESSPGFGWALPFDENYRKKPAYTAMLKQLETPLHEIVQPSTR